MIIIIYIKNLYNIHKMKSFAKYITEVSAEFMRKAASRQRQLLDDDKYLDGKTAAEYKKLLKRAEKFDKYADTIEAKEAENRFLRQTNGTLVYNRDGIQIKLYGDFKCKTEYNCYDRDEHERGQIYKEVSFTTGDIMDYYPTDEEIKDELGDNYGEDTDEPVNTTDIDYPEIRIYYNYHTTPIITIEDLTIEDAYAKCGPGGSSYYYGNSFFNGDLNWGDITIDEDNDDIDKLIKSLKKPLCNAIAHVINYPMGYEFIDEFGDIYYNDDFQKIDCDDLIDAIMDEC